MESFLGTFEKLQDLLRRQVRIFLPPLLSQFHV